MKPSEIVAGMSLCKKPLNGDHRVYRVMGKDKLKVHLRAADVPTREEGFNKYETFVVPVHDIQKCFSETKHKGIFIKELKRGGTS